jgi:hypothetical protein
MFLVRLRINNLLLLRNIPFLLRAITTSHPLMNTIDKLVLDLSA